MRSTAGKLRCLYSVASRSTVFQCNAVRFNSVQLLIVIEEVTCNCSHVFHLILSGHLSHHHHLSSNVYHHLVPSFLRYSAAMTVQRVFRGVKARLLHRFAVALKEWKEIQKHSATLIQRIARGGTVRSTPSNVIPSPNMIQYGLTKLNLILSEQSCLCVYFNFNSVQSNMAHFNSLPFGLISDC